MAEGEKKLLLVVEDEQQMMKLLKETLEGEGFAVKIARTGEDALMHAAADHPDLLLLDLMLPGMNGIKVLEEARKSPWGKELPVIILTNISPDEKIMPVLVRDEPAYYIVKAEASMDDIVAKIRSALGMGNEEIRS